jgi:hypothetical protein
MRTLGTLVLMLVCYCSFSCSVALTSFCELSHLHPDHNIIKGTIIDSIPRGIRLKVLSVIRGIELRDTVIIWDGTDIECNGPFSQAASLMGNAGDTILTVMAPADTIREPWQVLGDYVRPYFFGTTPELKIENDTLKGFISGGAGAPAPYQVWRLHFDDFITYWNSHSSSCNTLVGIEEKEVLNATLFPNPANQFLTIEGIDEEVNIKFYSAQGAVLLSSAFRNHQVDISSLPQGVYTAVMSAYKKEEIRRIIKLD